MIKVSILGDNKGFEIDGHSGMSRRGSDIVCASVSSAAYMTVNTITDVFGVDVKVNVDDGYMQVVLTEESNEAEKLIEGFKLHIDGLAEQYPEYVVRLK